MTITDVIGCGSMQKSGYSKFWTSLVLVPALALGIGCKGPVRQVIKLNHPAYVEYVDHRKHTELPDTLQDCVFMFYDDKSNGPGVERYTMSCQHPIRQVTNRPIESAPNNVKKIADNIEQDFERQEAAKAEAAKWGINK
jgi:hypothetical protein